MPKKFDVALEKLTPGVNLVEAGAGSGKTFAITMLVLRAVAELFMPIETILVVTFTRAATEELRDRIRRRLRQAEKALAFADGDYDEILTAWRDNIENIEKSRAAIHKALHDIDRAEISSIHGFCQKTLQEHALAGGEPPDSDLADEKDCRRQIAEDFWRRAVYPLPAWQAALLRQSYASPETLAKSVGVASGGEGDIRPQNLPMPAARAGVEAARAELRRWWYEFADSFQERLDRAIAEKCFKKELTENWPEGWPQLAAFATGADTSLWPEKFLPWLTADGLRGLIDGNKVRGEAKKEALLVSLAPFADQEIASLRLTASRFILALRLQLAKFIRQEIPARLRREGQVSYNELIRRLAQALAADTTANLTSELRHRYRMALIDEFQDTDIWQWRIFRTLFATGKHYLYLIGDPKQAIYRFRGADIFSYFQAGLEADAHLSLTKNFRSHPLLVAEINRLFAGRPRPFFLAEELIGFTPAEAGRNAEDGSLWQHGQPLPVCRYRLVKVEGSKSRENIEQATRDDCRRQIVALLDPENRVEYVRLDNGQEIRRPLSPEDIAILTRTNDEAEALAQTLALHSIATTLDSRLSVFSSQECQDLLTALTAMATPGRTATLASALASDWFGLDGGELAAILADEERMGAARERWHGYQRRWLDDGVAAAILALLAGEAVYEHLRLLPRFERRIANILHLSELLSAAASAQDFGPGECLEWLAARFGDGSDEDSEMRLESDRPSVRIVTMHGAKGLEFPVVFCPSLWRSLAGKKSDADEAVCHDGGQVVVDLGSSEFAVARQAASEEERAEELRLLYVALTRAKLQCVIFWPLFDGELPETVAASPLSYLLTENAADVLSSEDMRQLFLARAEAAGVSTEDADAAETGTADAPLIGRQTAAKVLTARQFHGQFDHSWQMASFSSLLRRGGEDDGLTSDTLASELSTFDARTSDAPIALPALPKGTRFGNLIHSCLDKMNFAAPEDQMEALTKYLAEWQSALFGFAGGEENVARLVLETVMTPLPAIDENAPGGWRLADLHADDMVKEMPWSFALKKIWPEKIGALLADDPAIAPLAGPPVAGYLTGFIDLFCQWQGKYYILDYKTNFLGDQQADYAARALTQTMAEHNYGLQYWLYTLAVHRWLAWQRADYDYDRHFGGVYYLFVRGMRRELPGTGVFATRPEREKLERLAALLGEQR